MRLWVFLLVLSAVGCVDGINDPTESGHLRFTSVPVTEVLHNDVYSYSFSAVGEGGPLVFQPTTLPQWLAFDSESRTLSGTATGDNLGSFPVALRVSDGTETAVQSFTIQVELKQVHTGSWRGHFPYDWPHDGSPIIGEYCDLYSDASGEDVKQAMLDRSEAILAEIKELMNIDDHSVFTFPPGRTKVDIYANRFNMEFYGGFAYQGGAIVMSYENPRYQPNEPWSANELDHEMFHVVETLIEGSPYLGPDVWFREGIADYYAGSDLIHTHADLNEWLAWRRDLPGGGNPIKIHLWEDFPDEVAAVRGQGGWYPMFELAVRYSMDEAGFGLSYLDVREMFEEMTGGGRSFAETFESHAGIPVQEFEDNFFDLIIPFLN